MSDAWMPFQPAIEEPSKGWPSSNQFSVTMRAGMETCCSLPRVSVKRRSTNFTSSSLILLITSATAMLNLLKKLKWIELRRCALHRPATQERHTENAVSSNRAMQKNRRGALCHKAHAAEQYKRRFCMRTIFVRTRKTQPFFGANCDRG